MRTRRWFLFGCLICTSLLLLSASSCQSFRIVDTIPPQDATQSRLFFTYHRIQLFWNRFGRVPATVGELLDVEGHDCSTKDGWGTRTAMGVGRHKQSHRA